MRIIKTDILAGNYRDVKVYAIASAFAILNYNCQLPFANLRIVKKGG
jgi:hypothetical protein